MTNNIEIPCEAGSLAKSKSSQLMLLFFALLFLVSPPLLAQQGDEPSSWAIGEDQASSSANAVAKPEPEPQAEPEPQKIAEPAATTQAEVSPLAEDNSDSSDQTVTGNYSIEGSRKLEKPADQPVRPLLNIDPQLRNDLEAQFQKVRKTLASEDAFSEALGEDYLSYGLLLKKAGRLDEAREKLVNALHIAKVNNGIYAIEQRPVLRALFDLNLALGNTEEVEDNLQRIIWLEKKYPDLQDDYSFEMVVQLGNYYVDLYFFRPVVNEINVLYLQKAQQYFSYAIARYGDRPISELLMPYGELALVTFLKSRLVVEADRSIYRQEPVGFRGRQTQSQFTKFRVPAGSFARGEYYLKEYLDKAKEEDNLPEVITALLNLGDLNLLFSRNIWASKYYNLAWSGAQQLQQDHPLRASFSRPQLLPAFNYAQQRDDEIRRRDLAVYVPLTFDLDENGKVRSFAESDILGSDPKLVRRAKRVAKRAFFRPVISDGKMVQTEGFTEDIQVLVRRSSENADEGQESGAVNTQIDGAASASE